MANLIWDWTLACIFHHKCHRAVSRQQIPFVGGGGGHNACPKPFRYDQTLSGRIRKNSAIRLFRSGYFALTLSSVKYAESASKEINIDGLECSCVPHSRSAVIRTWEWAVGLAHVRRDSIHRSRRHFADRSRINSNRCCQATTTTWALPGWGALGPGNSRQTAS